MVLARAIRVWGTGLHWESLDVDFTIAGLMNGIFGIAKLMDAQRRGGQSRCVENRGKPCERRQGRTPPEES